ncbi:hypothetical protein KR222_011059 [Zaprionus bogoriensis]|nr:hypothetical protein KR222_011059 [Zaprionus bogoriensis]
MQRTNIEFERQRHLANWLVKSSPHMAAAAAASAAAAPPPTGAAISGSSSSGAAAIGGAGGGVVAAVAQGAPGNSAAACNGVPPGAHHLVAAGAEARKPKLRRYNSHDTSSNMFSVADFENARLMRRNEIELKQRLARRQRNSANGSYGLCGGSGGATSGGPAANAREAGGLAGTANGHCSGSGYNGFCGGLMGSGDYSTGDSKQSKLSSSSSEEPLPADVFLERHSLPRIVRILYTNKSSNETLQSSSSHGSSTVASSSSSAGTSKQQFNHNNNNNNNSSSSNNNNDGGMGTGTTSSSSGGSGGHQHQLQHHNSIAPGHDELFLLYRMVLQRSIYHGYNAKSQASQRKKTVLIPQEFPGYFSLLNEKGLPTATQYCSLMQLVRERVYKFASVDNMPAFSESQPGAGAGASASASSPNNEGCMPAKNRPQYVKTTARGGQVFRLLAVFEDGKQEGGSHANQASQQSCKQAHVASVGLGRDKEKGRYAQLLNEQRQVMYVPLSTKGKFYEIEPGIPQLLQKLGGDTQRKLNAECVHRLGPLVAAAKQLPLMLRYISGPPGAEVPEQLCISQVSKEDVIVGCPIEELADVQANPAAPVGQLRKLYLSREMQLSKCLLGFDTEQRMFANSHVQNMLKFCQFNCDQFLKLVEIELLQRSERSGSKTREGLKILKPLHLPKLLRREKSSMATSSAVAAAAAASAASSTAHEKEDSIIFLSKSDLEQLEQAQAQAQAQANDTSASSSTPSGGNRITERMKVFQSTKKKWFRKQAQPTVEQQEQQHKPSTAEQIQAKRMSMERYTDMSKLLQERFGGNLAQLPTPQADTQSLHSETEQTTLSTSMDRSSMPKSLDTLLQKSMSLQDIELLNGQRQPPDLLSAHHAAAGQDSDAISEEDVENQTPPPQSFITEKLYNEFHVKTRQYSKSSSSLHQLRHFSLPQKLQLHETEREKRSLAQFKAQQQQLMLGKEPITGRRAAGGVSLLGGLVSLSPAALLSPTSLVEDDLPYSSVRDSLVTTSLGSAPPHEAKHAGHADPLVSCDDYPKENIYAEICASHTCDSFSGATQLTQLLSTREDQRDDEDDDGDYASLKYQPNGPQSVSRVEISCTPATSAISYHTVYLGEEPLGEQHAGRAGAGAQHVTTVELAGETHDNIYNTLK